jgi:hypothetical protein
MRPYPKRAKRIDRFLMSRHRTAALVVAGFAFAGLFATTLGASGTPSVEELSPRVLFTIVNDPVRNTHHQLMVRELRELSAIQFDAEVDGEVVSFISAWGADRRASCELVYLTEDHWFGWCDVFDFQFGSFREWQISRPKCRGCTTIRRYFFGAHSLGCGPLFLGETKVPMRKGDLALQAASELTYWDTGRILELVQALRLVGDHGCPRLGSELLGFFGVDSGAEADFDEMSASTEIPESLAARLDHQQLNGLTGWLENVVDRIP